MFILLLAMECTRSATATVRIINSAGSEDNYGGMVVLSHFLMIQKQV